MLNFLMLCHQKNNCIEFGRQDITIYCNLNEMHVFSEPEMVWGGIFSMDFLFGKRAWQSNISPVKVFHELIYW
jgi:hypothetical protein